MDYLLPIRGDAFVSYLTKSFKKFIIDREVTIDWNICGRNRMGWDEMGQTEKYTKLKLLVMFEKN